MTETDYLYQYEYVYDETSETTTEQVLTYFTTVATTTSIEIIKPTNLPGSSVCLPHAANVVQNVIETIMRKSVTFCVLDELGKTDISSTKARFRIPRKHCSPSSGWNLKFYKSHTESFGMLRSKNCRPLKVVVRRERLFILGSAGELHRIKYIAQF